MEQLLIQATLLRAKRLDRRLQDAQTANNTRDDGSPFQRHSFPISGYPNVSKHTSPFSCLSRSPFQDFGFENSKEKPMESEVQSNIKGRLKTNLLISS